MTVAVIVATAAARDRLSRPARAARRDGAGDRATAATAAGAAGSGEPPGKPAPAARGAGGSPTATASDLAAGPGGSGREAERGGTPANTATALQPAATLPCPALRAGQAVTEPLLGRLCGQLVTLGIRDMIVIAACGFGDRLRDIAWDGVSSAGMAPAVAGNTVSIDVIECGDVASQLRAIARVPAGQRRRNEGLLICAGDVIAHTDALAAAAGSAATAALVEAQDAPAAALFTTGPDLRPAMRTAGPRPAVRTAGPRPGSAVAAAGSAFHRVTAPDAAGCGVFLVAAGDVEAMAAAAEQLAVLAGKADAEREAGTPPAAGTSARRLRRAPAFGDPVALLLVGLVRGGVPVAAVSAEPLRCVRAATTQQARAAAGQLHAAPEDTLRMKAAVKAADGFVATFLVSPYSRYVARWAARREVSPHAVTAASAGLALIAAVWFSAGTRAGLVTGAVFVFGTFVLDCVDGQVARYSRSPSVFGSWLDPVSDRVKEYAVYAGLAAGGTAAHQPGVWGLAIAAMIVQAIRHMITLSYRLASPAASAPEQARGRPLPLDEPADYAVAVPPAETRSGAAGPLRAGGQRFRRAAASAARALRWLGRIGYLPAGERFVVIAVTAAVAGPRMTFLVLLGWGGAAALTTLVVLIARSLAAGRARDRGRPARWPAAALAMASYRDDGIIAQALGRVVAGQLPPLLPAVAGVTVTVALAAAGLHYGGIIAIAPVAAMLLAGLGRAHPHDGRLDWLVPPLLLAGEYIYLGAVGISAGVPRPIVFALLAAIAVHHYDVGCRARLGPGIAPPPWAVRAGLGWEGRMLVAALGAMLGIAPFAYAVLSAYVWIFFSWESLTSWLSGPREHLLTVAQAVDLEDGGGW